MGRTCLVRACYNRVVVTASATDPVRTKLFDRLRSLPAQGEYLQTLYDSRTRKERKAWLALSWEDVWLQPPHVRKGEYANHPVRVWAVRVWEVNAAAGATPVDWMLLSSAAVTDVEAARQKLRWYACRSMVEEYHKGMKTGCQVEDLPFRSEQALQPMIALLSVVAVLLLNLRLACRQSDADQRLATELVESIYEETLRNWRYRNPRGLMTVREYYLALARLGGHMNRKSDGPPGWLVLWRGWMKLHLLVTGVEGERRRRRTLRGET